MIINTSKALNELLTEFAQKSREENFVFRGHADSSWLLQPKAFRMNEIEKSWENYPLSKKTIQQEWIENEETFSRINGCFERSIFTKDNYKETCIIYKKYLIPLARILWHYIDIMRYNFDLRNYIDHNQNYYSPEYLEYLRYLERPCDFWRKFDAFLLFLLTEILPMIECRDIDTNKLLNKINISESRASVDETRPQHYGVATSALDWTSDPFIALYFAASRYVDVGLFSSMIITPPLNFSLFEYKQLKDDNDVSIKLESPNNKIVNDRAVKQKGKFTFFTKANSFYLLHEKYPAFDDYRDLNEKEFFLRKHDIQLNNDTISYIKNKLEQLDINQNTLGLT